MGVNGIYGLSGSGLDIESMVKVGMMSKQNEYDKMAQKYTKNEWTKAAYLELNSSITSFNMTKLSDYKMSSSMNAKTATSSDSTIKVTANANAVLMMHKVEVDTVASNAYLVGTEAVTRKNTSDDAKNSIKLADAIFKGAMTTNDNGENFSVSYGDESNPLTTLFNKDDVAFKFTISDGSSNSKEIKYTYGDLYEGKTFNNLVSDINNAGLNVRATYDSINDRFSFYNTEGGKENTIKFTLDTVTASGYDNVDTTNTNEVATLNARDFLNNLHLKKSAAGETEDIAPFTVNSTGSSDNIITGQDGKIKIDGVEYTTTDNKVTVGGITYDTTAATKNAAATVSISQDVDSIVDKVKSFVEDYNKILSSLYEKYDEKPDSNYKPLTQTQKDGMKEEQITKWEEKAKAGLLYHDQTLSKIILSMRSAISSSITLEDGTTTSAYSIGISTTGIKGQLKLDETKLKQALADNPDAVYNVFAKLDANDADNSAKSGIAQRLGDVFSTATKSIRSRAGSSSDVTEDSDLNNLLRNLQTKMSNFKKMMDSFEDALYKKYDKMETALARLGTQMNYVMGSTSQ